MNIAVYTLTRERLEYTKRSFALLHEKAGYPFDHYVIDNGSQDGTRDWLLREYMSTTHGNAIVYAFDTNRGISAGSNKARGIISQCQYDLVVKMDNDCFIHTDGILEQFASIYKHPDAHRYVLGPEVRGLSRIPALGREVLVGGRVCHQRAVVGGIFRVCAYSLYKSYPGYPTTLPYAWGQDDAFCEWLRQNNYGKAQVQGLVVEHADTTDGQCRKFPDYFERKWREEKEVPA